MRFASTVPAAEVPLGELLLRILPPADAAAIVASGVGLCDLARHGQPGAASLVQLSERARRVLEAAFELGRRRSLEELPRRPVVRDASDVVRLLRPHMLDEPVEVFRVVLLDTRHRVMGCPVVSRGTLATSLVHPREVLRPAVVAQAAAVVVAHNHPSGTIEPSPQDHAVTERLARSGRLLGVPVLDHVILGAQGHFSFRDRGEAALSVGCGMEEP